jgi:two-component system, LytTR family, response regulator
MLKAILIDDEESNLSSLKEKLIAYCPQVEIIALCNSGAEGIEAIDTMHPDIVFLDIEMPVMNGFVMLKQLHYTNFELVFVTAYDHYTIRAIRCSALDYLVKPVELEELKAAVERAAEKRKADNSNPQIELFLEQLMNKKNGPPRIAIPDVEGLHFIRTEDIIYLEANINYTNIYCAGEKKYVASRTLKDFEELLSDETFIRIHNSHIINKNYAKRYIRGEGGQVVLSNGIVLDVAKRKKAGFLKSIGE